MAGHRGEMQLSRIQNTLIRNRPLATLMLGHFTVDMYVGLLPVLYPLLMDRFTLDLKTVGLISLAYSGVASLSQPFFGWVADRYGTRFTGLALLWTAITFATIGFAPSFPVLIVLASLAGMGSGAFHPLGAVNASAVIPEGQRNTAMSIYVTGGTIGVATGPIVGALIFTLFGVHGTALMILPGAGIALWLLYEMRSIALPRPERSPANGAPALAPIPLALIAIIVGVMMARMWTLFGIQAFVPTWYKSLGYSASFYGPLATTIILASAVGAIGSGRLADRFGRREVILWSLILSIPPILLFTWITGPPAFIFGALIGLTAASTGPLLLVMAQQLMRGRAGMASGVILGLGFVTGAIGVPVMGAIADSIGIAAAMRVQVLMVVVTIGLAWLLPSDETVRSLAAEPVPVRRGKAAEA
ncbi:MAG TPA: MFS transporter [Thermomicrobiales bacterium]|nr:MFS transporter [Thermomicrobiales bacterium]